jgi:hypothetical protein
LKQLAVVRLIFSEQTNIVRLIGPEQTDIVRLIVSEQIAENNYKIKVLPSNCRSIKRGQKHQSYRAKSRLRHCRQIKEK